MTKKLTVGVALIAALAIAITAVGVANHAVACDKNAKTTTASFGCSATAAKTASASSCSKATVAGCPKAGKRTACGASCAKACCDAEAKHAAALKKIVDEIPYGERRRVVVAGSIECGSCTYKATTSCQPLLKTTDGKVYPLMRSGMVKKMRKSGATSVTVSSSVRRVDGVKYLDVKSFSAI
jgi:hypothetical protein